MDDLVAWLRAQLDEDERVARWAQRQRAEDGSTWWWDEPDSESGAEHLISLFNPDRVLREVEAKRGILDDLPNPAEVSDGMWLLSDRMIRRLVSVYADRPGYRDEWRP